MEYFGFWKFDAEEEGQYLYRELLEEMLTLEYCEIQINFDPSHEMGQRYSIIPEGIGRKLNQVSIVAIKNIIAEIYQNNESKKSEFEGRREEKVGFLPQLQKFV